MRYFSMFSGIGGFELGIQRAFDMQPEDAQLQMESNIGGDNSDSIQRTASCVGYSEIDKYAIKVYERQFNGHRNFGDATTINPSDIPDFDLLVGGFPCQAFSIAGKRAGFDDTRGTLFFDIARILKEKQPRHLVLENVKGLLSHDSGRTFTTIIGVLTDLGYLVEWQVLNSKNFGVPQNRERVYIVGHLGNECGRKVFPITASGKQPSATSVKARSEGERVFNYVANTLAQRDYKGGNQLIAPNGKTIDLSEAPDKPVQLLEVRTELGKKTRREIRQAEGRDSTKRGKQDKKYIPKNDDLANCVTTGQANIEKWVIDLPAIRRLTPTECERLQGFPDDWTRFGGGDESISDSQRYKMCGNAVTVNVVEAVMAALTPCLYY